MKRILMWRNLCLTFLNQTEAVFLTNFYYRNHKDFLFCVHKKTFFFKNISISTGIRILALVSLDIGSKRKSVVSPIPTERCLSDSSFLKQPEITLAGKMSWEFNHYFWWWARNQKDVFGTVNQSLTSHSTSLHGITRSSSKNCTI